MQFVPRPNIHDVYCVCLIIFSHPKSIASFRNFEPFASLSFSWFTCNQKPPLIEERPKTMRLNWNDCWSTITRDDKTTKEEAMMMVLIRSHDCHYGFFFLSFLSFALIHFHHTHGTITHSSFTRETQSIIWIGCYQSDKKTKKNQQRFKKELVFSI